MIFRFFTVAVNMPLPPVLFSYVIANSYYHLLPILPTLPKRPECDLTCLIDYTYLKLMRPNEAYISGEMPNSTYIVGGCLTCHLAYVGLCSLHRYLPFS